MFMFAVQFTNRQYRYFEVHENSLHTAYVKLKDTLDIDKVIKINPIDKKDNMIKNCTPMELIK